MLTAFRQQRARHPHFEVPDGVLSNAMKIAQPVVSDLSSSPLIEKITFGVSMGEKGG